MTIRAARGDDFERVLPLVLELGRPPDHHRTHDDLKVLYEEQIVRPDVHHLVAEDDVHLVGFLALHFRVRIGWVTPEAWIADLVVAESVRNHGIGRDLVNEAERRARGRECHRIVADSGYRDAEAHQLFRSAGMRDLGKHFVKQLT